MKLCRFQPLELPSNGLGRGPRKTHPRVRIGVAEDSFVHEISGELWGERARTRNKWPINEIKFLPPSVPSKIVCVGRNYFEHAKELGNQAPKEPLIFLKPPSAIIGPEEPIVLPAISQRVDFEGELAVVVGRRCRALRPSQEVSDYIAGYTCLNDVTARDLQKRDGQCARVLIFAALPLPGVTSDLLHACVEPE